MKQWCALYVLICSYTYILVKYNNIDMIYENYVTTSSGNDVLLVRFQFLFLTDVDVSSIALIDVCHAHF